MWTRGEKDAIERKYHVRASAYLSSVIGILQRNPHAQPLVREFVGQESKRLDEFGLDQEVDTVLACVSEAPFVISRESLLALDEDVYAVVVSAVQGVIFRIDDKILAFQTDLALLVKDEKLRTKIGKLAVSVFTGAHLKNG